MNLLIWVFAEQVDLDSVLDTLEKDQKNTASMASEHTAMIDYGAIDRAIFR